MVLLKTKRKLVRCIGQKSNFASHPSHWWLGVHKLSYYMSVNVASMISSVLIFRFFVFCYLLLLFYLCAHNFRTNERCFHYAIWKGCIYAAPSSSHLISIFFFSNSLGRCREKTWWTWFLLFEGLSASFFFFAISSINIWSKEGKYGEVTAIIP